jgi:sugar phosphate isomerase/epimerase
MKPPIAVQLYSVRQEMERDLAGTLKRLETIGYRGVELAGCCGRKPGEFRRMIQDGGFEIVASHIPIPSDEAVKGVLDEQEEVGARLLIVSHPENAFECEADVERAADRLGQLGTQLAGRNMRIGVHNHWWEFRKRFRGRSVFEILASRVLPLVFFELDIYWAQTGGENPLVVAEKAGDRVELLHVKDGPCVENQPMTALGTGQVDLLHVLPAFSKTRWHIVELDACASDMLTAIQESYGYLVRNRLSDGRVVPQ